ncbi:uncharacterized protein EV154DRAFT_525108 [Mucor mucedo]|uniref:uncharacterized protein n=1 Tax=Mucor mucedo TaxID=29922 RepID=UPI00221FD18C|nr:uncharacterized protein EV154DRAFT_525108 [Mucor mucedo]KAI7878391.1 hypothetical protein EV154DRAFT_525108 [Mucor mucedo]
MSSRLARQSLDLLTSAPTKKTNQSASQESKKQPKIKLPKINKGIKKVKHEIRYGQHQKTRALQAEIQKRDNPIEKLKTEEEALDERMKRNVQIMKRALRSSSLEKKIHKEVIQERFAKKTKKWSSKVEDSDSE